MLLSTTIGIGVSSSTEFDYQSFGGNISFSQKTRDAMENILLPMNFIPVTMNGSEPGHFLLLTEIMIFIMNIRLY